MRRRDIAWRTGGAALVAAGWATAHLLGQDEASFHAEVALIGVMVAMLGLVLLIQGRHLPAALRVERSRHRELPATIRARRVIPRAISAQEPGKTDTWRQDRRWR